jgi:TolB-like protein
MRKRLVSIVVPLAMLFLAFAPPRAYGAPRVAVLALENRSGDPRYDYIGGIAHGLLLYDLSSSGAVELLDRGGIDALLKERELSLSAIAAAPTRAYEDISSADYIVAGEYVLLGSELRLTLKLVDVATSRVATFSDSGSTENLIHGLAELLVERVSGKRPSLREEGRSRSILSLRDETPGSIALFSPLVDAQVFLDGSFIGYTTGDRRVPFVIEGVDPGERRVSTDLGRDFGVIGLPEVSFGPWTETVKVVPGKRVIVTDRSSHFNDILYRLKRLVRESKTVAFDASGSFSASYPFSFTDRAGAPRYGRVSIELSSPAAPGSAGRGTLSASLDDQARSLDFDWPQDQDTEITIDLGLVGFTAEVESRYGRVEATLEAERNDVDQGMHRQRDQ